MLTPKQFNDGEALSRTNQPYIEKLINYLADDDKPITLFVGAGLGIDAGFPNWPRLVQRLAEAVGEHEGIPFGEFAVADKDDLIRKAEYLIQALNAKRKYTSNPKEIVREMLYRDSPGVTQPGPLAKALALLVKVLGPRVTILTTNFEDVIDAALKDVGVGYRLLPLGEAAKIETVKAAGLVPIVHLHGRLGRSYIDDLGDVVLTESEFLFHGKGVRDVVATSLRASATIVLGVSMTDPNLVGPLWETKSSRNGCFVLTVPLSLPGTGLVESRTFGLVKNNYLNELLGLLPIFLKSYSQLTQLLHELELATLARDAYLSDDVGVSLAYGVRFTGLLRTCFQNLGYEVIDDEVLGEPSPETTAKLRDRAPSGSASAKRVGVAPQNTGELIAALMRDRETVSRLEKRRFQLGDVHSADESFALFLWLRNFSVGAMARYSLRLAASSAFELTEVMARPFSQVSIESDAAHTAARSLATGKGMVWNVPLDASGGVWAGVSTAPVRILELLDVGSRQIEIPTTVGAISLYSTHTFDAPREAFPIGKHVSIMSVLDVAQKRELLTRLELDARSVITKSK